MRVCGVGGKICGKGVWGGSVGRKYREGGEADPGPVRLIGAIGLDDDDGEADWVLEEEVAS